MLRIFYVTFILILNSNSFAKASKDRPTVSWLMLHYAPYYIQTGPLRGEGVHNKLVDYFIKSLPEYHHKKVHVNVPRLFKTLEKEGEQAYCSPGFGGKRLPLRLKYSEPMFLGPPPGLVFRKDHPIKESSEINLNEMVSSMKIKIGKPEKGAYGPKVQEIFVKNPDKFVNINVSEVRVGNGMVLKGRIDAFISYSLAFMYYQKYIKNGELLKFIKVKEFGQYIPTHSLCTSNTLGEEVLGKVNLLIKKNRYREIVKSSMLRFMPLSLQTDFLKKNKL